MQRLSRYLISGGVASVLALALIGHALATHDTAASGTVLRPHTVPAPVAHAQSLGPLAATMPLTITVALAPPDAAGLARVTTAVATPGNPLFRHFMTPATFAAAFAPPAATVAATLNWLIGAGWHVSAVRSGGLFISAGGTAGLTEATFGVALQRLRATNGATFYSNTQDLRLPVALAPDILAVTGLDDIPYAHPHDARPTTPHPVLPDAASGCPTNGNGAYLPAQLAGAYEFPTMRAAHTDRLAMVELDGYLPGDISAFARCFAPNAASLVRARPVDATAPLAASDGAIEVELDIEIALALTPSLAGMDVYEAPNTGAGWLDLFAALANDNTDGTVSISWGSCEAEADNGTVAAENVALSQMVTQGQDVFVAAGDTGAYDCLTNDGSGSGDGTVSADDPAANPHVVAVGGTTLTLTNGGSYGGESIWNTSAAGDFSGGGGGSSTMWSSPAWQAQSLATTGTNVGRALPDVTADSDPDTGYVIYCTQASGCGGAGWQAIGGTSAATPLWAALATGANAALGSRTGLITPALYSLYGADAQGLGGITSGGTTYDDYAQGVGGTAATGAVVFHDIVTGNNSFPGFAPGYSARVGFDRASGIGSMHGQTVIAYLTAVAGGGGNPTPGPTGQLTAFGRGSDGRYWLTTILPGKGQPSGTWVQLDPLAFAGPPAVADDGAGGIWVAGVGTDGALRYGRYTTRDSAFSGWSTLTGATCLGVPALAFAGGTLFVTCRTTGNGIAINALNVAAGTWGGWAWFGGGVTASPTLATDGTSVLVVAQASRYRGDGSVWYTTYAIGSGATQPWRTFPATCAAPPGLVWTGAPGSYALSCLATTTRTVWRATFTLPGPVGTWTNAGTPAPGLSGSTAITLDRTDGAGLTFILGQGRDNAAYLWQSSSALSGAWQRISLPGIFTGPLAADYH